MSATTIGIGRGSRAASPAHDGCGPPSIPMTRKPPLDADLTEKAQRGEDILTQAEAAARRQDFEVEGDLLQARDAGHAIVDEAMERQADAIIIGVPFKRPFGEFELSRVPTHVLRTAQCEVVLLRMPSE